MIASVDYGGHELVPWYQSPGYIDFEAKYLKSYRSKEPQPAWSAVTEDTLRDRDLKLFVCPVCFLYTSAKTDLPVHAKLCRFSERPPGKLVYDTPKYTIREVECTTSSIKLYMQSLALFGKLFLETKSICFAVENFWIYVLTDKQTGLVAGFFSKEKSSWFNYNLACIVVFPPFQRQGYGHALIDFSYYLTRRDHTVGAPEQPISEFGRRSYMRYWSGELSRLFVDAGSRKRDRPVQSKGKDDALTLRNMALATGIDPGDVVAALEHMGALSKTDTPRKGTLNTDVLVAHAEKKPLPTRFDESFLV